MSVRLLPIKPHRWDLMPLQMVELQKQLAGRVLREDRLRKVRHVAGVDIGFEDDGRTTRAAIAVLSWPELTLVQHAIARCPTRLPYIPGLLSFREIPAALAAFAKLEIRPDLLLVDGQGIAHPRRFGVASHLGLLLGIPSIGVAKSRLLGRHEEPGAEKGNASPLTDKGELIGAVLRTRKQVKPLYISIGHGISLESAVNWTLACCTRYRLPETTRWAHRLASGDNSRIDQAPPKRL